MTNGKTQVISLAAALEWRARLRACGGTLVVTNGCFDVLHAGHVALLETARREADALLVLVNSDASVRALKGPGRPINACADRTAVLAALRCVAAVVVFEGLRCDAELAALQPDVYVKSAEYAGKLDASEAAALAACRARLVFVTPLPGRSTTGILQRVAGRDASLSRSPTHTIGDIG